MIWLGMLLGGALGLQYCEALSEEEIEILIEVGDSGDVLNVEFN
jgi:hypothetical protein